MRKNELVDRGTGCWLLPNILKGHLQASYFETIALEMKTGKWLRCPYTNNEYLTKSVGHDIVFIVGDAENLYRGSEIYKYGTS